MPMALLVAIAVLTVILHIGDLQHIAPMLPTSFLRWKECIRFFNSTNMNRSKNTLARALILPFVLICTRFELFPPASYWTEKLCGAGADHSFVTALLTAGVFGIYLILRALCVLCFKGKNIEKNEMSCARNCIYIFFICAVTFMFAASGICSLLSVNQSVTSNILLAVLAFVYGIGIIRKTQIFTHYRGYLAGILYLCTLEILPTGLLIVSGLIF